MDSLEARLRFITILKNLQKTLNVININEMISNKQNIISSDNSAIQDSHDSSLSTTPTPTSLSTFNIQTNDNKYENPIEFYLRNYKDHYEDFHQCLLDTLRKFNVLDRLPIVIFYFKLIYILYYDLKETPLTQSILKDIYIPSILDILNFILPENDIISLTNLDLCSQLVNNLLGSPRIDIIIPSDLQLKIKNIIKSREKLKQNVLQDYKTQQLILPTLTTNTIEPPTILNRMEMDRDRHKRSKETNWKVKRLLSSLDKHDDTMLNPIEFQRQWDTLGPMTETDLQESKTLISIAQESYLL